ncbi:TPA: hypothetical protein SCR51_001249 [Citrobacter freundii]|uniref:hypothetical protein n=1 Tax=Citrobacter freundii TaxID=546 RepID=UPI0029830BE1|nr:hypothetical protein [Citrobacter freundii]HEG1880914.1 hypothetical protein [Citrobacter freundii]
MKPDVNKIIADIKATKGNRKFCNGLAGTLQDDNYASSICKYVKTVTPERIDLLIEYAEKLEAEVTDMAVQLANAESKCRELAVDNASLKNPENWLLQSDYGYEASEVATQNGATEDESLRAGMIAIINRIGTPATDAFLAEVRAQGVEIYADTLDRGADDAERDGFDDGVKFLRAEAEGVRKFAAQLRKGAKS